MRVLFLNQYFPPDPAPTGVLLAEIADELRAGGDTVDFVAARQEYRGGQRRGRRMRREFSALAQMLLDGLRRPRADVVFSASSPPCLLVVATLLAWWHRAKSVHWAMDLYPEIAVALGEVRDGLLVRILDKLMGWCYRRAALVVALDGDMADQLCVHGVTARVARPWVVPPRAQPALECGASARRFSHGGTLSGRPSGIGMPDVNKALRGRSALQSASREEEWSWIYSGNLGRAHEWETLLEAQALLEARGVPARLLFQGGGPAWREARERAEALGLHTCEWRDYVPETELCESLLRAECCVVTQRPETRGLLWPSKLALILSLPRRILFVGPDGEIARMLRPLPHAGVFAPGDAAGVAAWIEAQEKDRALSPAASVDAHAHRAESLANWHAWMRELSPERELPHGTSRASLPPLS